MAATKVDEGRLEALMGRAVGDMGAAVTAPLMLIGEKLGLYKAMAGAGPLTPAEVAERSGAAERYVREWLGNQAAGGYVDYDPGSGRYELSTEQAMALADEDSPFYVLGFYSSIASLFADEERLTEAFRTGEGVGWHEHDHRLFVGTERFFRPGYSAHLVSEWIPALEGVREKLERGAKVADIGCGHGASRAKRRSPSRAPRTTRVATTTSCAHSTACTTWAIRPALRRMCSSRSLPTAPG
jgi:hypothetical protein